MGTEDERSSGLRSEAPAADSGRRQGGQAYLGTFGVPKFGGRRASRPVQGKAPSPLQKDLVAARTPHIRRGTFQAFVRLSEQEVRPVEDVMAEWLHDCGALIEQNELAEVYGDARQSTPAMRLAALAADERERSGYVDDEEAAREHAALGAGYVEIQLAVD